MAYKSEKTSWKNVDRWGIDQRWSGTAAIYSASGRASWGLTGDYEVTYRKESEPDELRAYREKRRRRGKRVEELGEDKISDHLVVIFGAELSARAAVATLEALIDRIREEGLIIGRVRDGDLTWETTDPSPRLIKR